MTESPRTAAGRDAVKMRGLFGGETEERATEWVRKIEAEAEAGPLLNAERLAQIIFRSNLIGVVTIAEARAIAGVVAAEYARLAHPEPATAQDTER